MLIIARTWGAMNHGLIGPRSMPVLKHPKTLQERAAARSGCSRGRVFNACTQASTDCARVR